MESTACRPTFHRPTAQNAADRSIASSMTCRHTPSLTMFFEIGSSERMYHNVDKPMNSHCAGNIIFGQKETKKYKTMVKAKNEVLPPNQLKPITISQ